MSRILLSLTILLIKRIFSEAYLCTGCTANVCVGTCNAAKIATITPCYGDHICNVYALFL